MSTKHLELHLKKNLKHIRQNDSYERNFAVRNSYKKTVNYWKLFRGQMGCVVIIVTA